jgi:hypothetical protein
MLHGEAFGVLVGAIVLGAVHGIEPGHGWPVAASYALDQTNKWLYGFAASFILGVGHLISSIAMVLVFFYAKDYFNLTQANEPITILGDIQIGGPVSLVAGVLLIALGIREYRHGHSHSHGPSESEPAGEHETPLEVHDTSHEHGHGAGHSGHGHDTVHERGHDHHQGHGHDHNHDHGHGTVHEHGHDHHHDHGDGHDASWWSRVKGMLPFVGGHSHDHGNLDDAANRGLLGIAWFAFVLGFAHEEEFEIIALCAGSNYCLELMSAYALTVIFGIVGLTMLLIAGYQHHREQVERYTPYLPAFSAAVLIIMGLGFISGLF